MSGSEPVWADQNHGGGWWSSLSGASTRHTASRQFRDAAGDRRQAARPFYPRLAVVKAAYNDGSRHTAEAIADWVATLNCGTTAYVEQIALGNWGVVVLRQEQPDALWVLTDQHLVFDRRRQTGFSQGGSSPLAVFSDDEFRACYDAGPTGGRVRECPIYEDQESAS